MIARWDDAYCTGNVIVDSQHRELFSLINEFSDAVANRRAHGQVGAILARLADYTREHFSEEERLMKGARYPDLEQHQACHRELTARTERFIQGFQSGELVLPLTLAQFLYSWLTSHIRGEDRRMVQWLAEARTPPRELTPPPLPLRRSAR